MFILLNDAPDDQVTILDASGGSSPRLSDLGTSILILESPSDANAGLYFCEVDFGSGSLNSSMAQLIITGEWEEIFVGEGGREWWEEEEKSQERTVLCNLQVLLSRSFCFLLLFLELFLLARTSQSRV